MQKHRTHPVLSAGADGAKQRPEGGDTEEKKSQISADSGLSVTSGSQVCVCVLKLFVWFLIVLLQS